MCGALASPGREGLLLRSALFQWIWARTTGGEGVGTNAASYLQQVVCDVGIWSRKYWCLHCCGRTLSLGHAARVRNWCAGSAFPPRYRRRRCTPLSSSVWAFASCKVKANSGYLQCKHCQAGHRAQHECHWTFRPQHCYASPAESFAGYAGQSTYMASPQCSWPGAACQRRWCCL